MKELIRKIEDLTNAVGSLSEECESAMSSAQELIDVQHSEEIEKLSKSNEVSVYWKDGDLTGSFPSNAGLVVMRNIFSGLTDIGSTKSFRDNIRNAGFDISTLTITISKFKDEKKLIDKED